MARQLKCWNGNGWGRSDYDETGSPISTPIEKYTDHLFVCAHSKAEAVRLVNSVSPHRINTNEINNYWHECWGNQMKDIEPEVGVWAVQSYNDKPIRMV